MQTVPAAQTPQRRQLSRRRVDMGGDGADTHPELFWLGPTHHARLDDVHRRPAHHRKETRAQSRQYMAVCVVVHNASFQQRLLDLGDGQGRVGHQIHEMQETNVRKCKHLQAGVAAGKQKAPSLTWS